MKLVVKDLKNILPGFGRDSTVIVINKRQNPANETVPKLMPVSVRPSGILVMIIYINFFITHKKINPLNRVAYSLL